MTERYLGVRERKLALALGHEELARSRRKDAENAVIEQSTCDYAAEQLWKPARFDESSMQLTNKLSGLLLDVAGANVDADFQSITQGKGGSSADTTWRLQKRSSAA